MQFPTSGVIVSLLFLFVYVKTNSNAHLLHV